MKLGIYLNAQHPAGRRSGAAVCRDAGAGAADPRPRVRLDLGRGAPRHAGLPLFPAAADAAAAGRGGARAQHRDQPGAAAAAQPGRDRRGRRLPRRDHRRALPAGRGARLPPGGVRDLRRADDGAGEPARRGRGDHPAALDRGQGHAPRAALDLRERDDPPAPRPAPAPAHPGGLAGARGHRARGPHRGRLARGAGPARGRVRGAGAGLHRGPRPGRA